ncbi:MAG: SDR family oxidoreductase [Candidatus Obscuribacterales bacterium]|nr:SDR family oxidoreductase [Candidatus Obscuribacterales bacterium]
MKFSGKTALVTGAGSGIGRATALAFAAQGAMVGALDINEPSVKSLQKEIEQAGGRCFAFGGDIAVPANVTNFVDGCVAQFGRVDFLFNNAGVEFISALADTDEADWDKVVDTNYKGTFLVSKACIPHLRTAGGGVIINNASDAGLRGIKMNAAYSSSKAAIIHLTRSVALDYGKYNIRCNCICPGCIRTPLCERFNAEVGARKGMSGEEVLKEFVDANIPMGRVGMPEEVASVVTFLCSEEGRYVSGAIIPIDGGLTAGM